MEWYIPCAGALPLPNPKDLLCQNDSQQVTNCVFYGEQHGVFLYSLNIIIITSCPQDRVDNKNNFYNLY